MALKIITFKGKSGQIVFQGKLTSLPLKEEKIISKSVEMFNDSDPCIIHKTYAMKKIMLDIDDYLNILMECGKTNFDWGDIPEAVKQSLNFKDEVGEISISIV